MLNFLHEKSKRNQEFPAWIYILALGIVIALMLLGRI